MSLLYLPITEPLGRPTVHRFGTDFGHGPLDAHHFQPSVPEERALLASCLVAEAERDRPVHDAALAWLDRTLADELGRAPTEDADQPTPSRYARRLADVAEDLVVVHRGDGEGSVRAVHVRAPSGWRPERALFATLATLHASVPELLARASATRLTQMMIDRGPYVRFVWGLTTSDAHDHHPDRIRKRAWHDADALYLRVERQITVPLRDVDAALFVLRVYVHDVASLDAGTRDTLATVLDALSPEMLDYKGIPAEKAARDRLIRR